MQLALPTVEPPPIRPPRRRSRTTVKQPPTQAVDDPLLAGFERRLASHGRARKGQRAYLYQMCAMLTIVARLTGRAMTCADLLRDEELLGRVLVDDVAPTLGIRVSRWTLAQRRSALRDFATLVRPELWMLLGEEPHDFVDRALRAVAERVGAGYRLTGGKPRRRGGWAPTEGEIRDVLDAVGRAPGYVGLRNRSYFAILAETGARVNALRLFDGQDCVEMPNGRLRIFLHEKGKAEPREVEPSRTTADALRAYAEAFNYLAATRRWGVRVQLGKPGAVWRNSPRGSRGAAVRPARTTPRVRHGRRECPAAPHRGPSRWLAGARTLGRPLGPAPRGRSPGQARPTTAPRRRRYEGSRRA